VLSPTDGGGAAPGTELGGSRAGGVTGTGGSTTPGSGGSTGAGSGGTKAPGAGGFAGRDVGGSTSPGAGGAVPPASGGITALGYGGISLLITGGATGVGAGGIKIGGTTGVAGGKIGAGGSAGGGGASSAGGATEVGGSTGGVTVRLDQTRQTMDGFGITNAWAPTMTDAEADALFDASKGLGLSILRIGMGADGNPMSNNTYSDIKKASARGVKTFIATAWSAPANCKDNNLSGGGHLLATCYQSWASTIAAFPALVKQNAGVDLYAMSLQNEPDYCGSNGQDPCSQSYPSMLYLADEMVAFVKAAGPKLRTLSPPVKVVAPEVSEWIHLWTNNSAPGSTDPLSGKYDHGHALSRDADAWAQLDILAAHQYDTQVAEPWPNDVAQSKPIWMTEMSGIKGWPEQGPSRDIKNGVAVAGWIHDAIVNGPASAWIWWWLRASSSDNNEGLYLQDGTDTKRHYTFGNYSRFIRPGYLRVDITGDCPKDILFTAYRNPDGAVVIVAVNKSSSLVAVPIVISGGNAPASLVPWVTSATDNLVSKTVVPVSGGSFTAALDGLTVTTYVGK
jgi:glucuronoarabinoxylan endo-1,4-beta-xylanase